MAYERQQGSSAKGGDADFQTQDIKGLGKKKVLLLV